jgi:hypothetical protein
VAALIAPTLTPSPPSPLAEVGGPSFAAPGSGAQLPLLLTATTAQFAGDAPTTEQGGTISLAPDGSLRMTLNNSALGVSGVVLRNGVTSLDRSSAFLDLTDFSAERIHVRNGSWQVYGQRAFSGGVWSTGFSTGPTAIPTTSTITYMGAVTGLISEYHIVGGEGVGLVRGNLSLNVDFATRTISGAISGLNVGTDGFYRTGPVNDLTFTATIDAGSNSYTGEVVSGPTPGGLNAFQAGVRGIITGQFFGPTAGESGGALTLSDGTARLIISFGARAGGG